MCFNSGGSSGPTAEQQADQQQQAAQTAQASADALTEQKREFDVSQAQRQTDLANQAALQKQQQDQLDAEAALASQWQTGRAQSAQDATASINDAFSKFTPDYYKGYTTDYENNYDPEVDRQYNIAKQNLTYGLARSGITNSQSAATQQGLLAQDLGRQKADIANQAVSGATALQGSVENAKQNLLSAALSDQTLGSPITPASADAVQAGFNQTSAALSQIKSNAGDVVNTLSAVPSYSPLGSLFGSAASGVSSYLQGQNAALFYGGTAPSPSASSPTAGSSRVQT